MKSISQLPDESNKGMFKSVLFQDITKKDGAISLILVILFEICSTLLLLFAINKNIAEVGTVYYIISSLLFFSLIIILNRKKLNTLGFRKSKIKVTILVFIIIFIISLMKNMKLIQNHNITLYDFIFNLLFNLITIFLTEEFIFRGYLWPRLVVLLGNHIGTIFCGAFWGIMHPVIELCYGEVTINYLTIFNSISMGILGQYLFAFLYSYSQNIYFPSIIHASYHFFRVERKLDYFIKIINIM